MGYIVSLTSTWQDWSNNLCFEDRHRLVDVVSLDHWNDGFLDNWDNNNHLLYFCLNDGFINVDDIDLLLIYLSVDWHNFLDVVWDIFLNIDWATDRNLYWHMNWNSDSVDDRYLFAYFDIVVHWPVDWCWNVSCVTLWSRCVDPGSACLSSLAAFIVTGWSAGILDSASTSVFESASTSFFWKATTTKLASIDF